jgi:hypothetical protein
MRKAVAAGGSAVFFVLAPGVVAGLAPPPAVVTG